MIRSFRDPATERLWSRQRDKSIDPRIERVAQGVAYHAGRLGVSATIVMPETTPILKVANTRALGAKVVLHGSNYDEAYAEAVRRVLQHPAVADKSFLITIGDRTITGLVARDQMVGPWQVPVADVAAGSARIGTNPPGLE